jgi:hypothetical protein
MDIKTVACAEVEELNFGFVEHVKPPQFFVCVIPGFYKYSFRKSSATSRIFLTGQLEISELVLAA